MSLDVRTLRLPGCLWTSGVGAWVGVYLERGGPGLSIVFLLLVSLMLAGCGDRVQRHSGDELRAFEVATSDGPAVDMSRIVRARVPIGPYRLVPGDVLQIEMPLTAEISLPAGAAGDGKQACNCRIDESGTILLPIIGEVSVAGKSLSEVESSIVAAYCQGYVKGPFPVYASVREYKTRSVSIVGAVARPGIYPLRQDQMSLVALLMEAGGVVEKGAAVIRVTRSAVTDRVPGADGIVAAAHLEDDERRTGGTAHAVFEREGPLNTTGWLGMEEGGTVILRRWIDIGNDRQRQSFLDAAATRSQWPASGDLQGRLSRLAVCLESNPRDQDVPPGIQDAGWQAMDRHRFVTRLRAPGAGPALKDAGSAVEGVSSVVVLPVRGLNIPFADVALEEGDTVAAEWPREQFVSVVGLVNRPGNFPYPPDAQYNLIQAVAFAGGMDMVADPRYVSVYRLRGDGTIASTTVQLVNSKNKEQLTEALAMPLKPGDIVSVEHTLRTRTNVFFDRVFRINLGLYLSPERLWQNG